MRVRAGSERGALIVQVAIALLVVCAFGALAVDTGVRAVARTQAQNAADAAALAAATALAFDDAFDETFAAEYNAEAVARANLVWLEEPSIDPFADVWPVTCAVPGFPAPPPELTGRLFTCVEVSVYRNQDRANPLPTFFGKLVGVESQGVRARATAAVVPANTTWCVWPLAIPDRWAESGGGWAPADTFVKYDPTGPPTLAPLPDVYTAPTEAASGTGHSLVFASLSAGGVSLLALTPADFMMPIAGEQFVPVQVPGGGFPTTLASCNGTPVGIGDTLALEATWSMADVTAAASTRLAADPTASWNTVTRRIQGSCAFGPTPCAAISPRLVLLPLFDLHAYEDNRWAEPPAPVIRIVNFVGFFITAVTGSSVHGHLTTYPGAAVTGRPTVGYISAFLRQAVLTR